MLVHDGSWRYGRGGGRSWSGLRFRAVAFKPVWWQDGLSQADAGQTIGYVRRTAMLIFEAFSVLFSYLSREMRQALPEAADIIRYSPLVGAPETPRPYQRT